MWVDSRLEWQWQNSFQQFLTNILIGLLVMKYISIHMPQLLIQQQRLAKDARSL